MIYEHQARNDSPQPDSSSGMNFAQLYKIKGVLGTGAFSTVREGSHYSNPGHKFAIKVILRSKLTAEDEAALIDEVKILRELRHCNIIRLYDFFGETTTYHMVMELMSGGELFDRIVTKAFYNEKEARDAVRILLGAVSYCHSQSVAHRDLKPENLLLRSADNDHEVKIADFGFAKKVLKPKSLVTQCGTPGYVAPEILEGTPYDTQADMWSVGVILYILLGGYPPFMDANQRELFRKIRHADYEFHNEYWDAVSLEAKGLIASLLVVNPDHRLNAPQALHHKWMLKTDEDLSGASLEKNLDELKNFNAKRQFKSCVSAVMAMNKMDSLGKNFRNYL